MPCGQSQTLEGPPVDTRSGNDLVLTAEKGARVGHAFVINFSWNSADAFSTILEAAGKIPLPPYMNRDAENDDSNGTKLSMRQAMGLLQHQLQVYTSLLESLTN